MTEYTGQAGGQGPEQAGSIESDSRKSSREALIALLKTGVLSRQRAASSPAVQAPGQSAGPGEAIVDGAGGSWTRKDLQGRIIATRDARGEERSFVWRSDGQLAQVNLPSGSWRRIEADSWESNHGQKDCRLRHVDTLGTYYEEDETRRTVYKQDGTRVEVHKADGAVTIFFSNGSSFSQQRREGLVRRIRNEQGSEYEFQVTGDGRLRPSYHKYASPIDVEFETPQGRQVVRDICEVRFDWQEANNLLKMTYRSSNGRLYVLERGRYGEFKSFGESNW